MNLFKGIRRVGLVLLVCLIFALSPVGGKPLSVQAQSGTQVQPLISDSLFLLSSTVLNDDVQSFLEQQPGGLASFTEVIDGENWSAARSITYNAFFYGINPRVILVLLEAFNGVLSHPNAQIPRAWSTADTAHGQEAFFYFVRNLASAAEERFANPSTGSREIQLADGTIVKITNTINAGTFALLTSLADLQSPRDWYAWTSGSSPIFVDTFSRWFGDPLYDPDKIAVSVDALPAGVNLPFPVGSTWYYTGGPHNYSSGSTARPWSSIDLAQPQILYCPETTTPPGDWIVAAAGGTVVQSDTALVVMDHGNGWRTYYSHVSTKDRRPLGNVNKGDRLGHPSCEKEPGGTTEGVHVHFAIYLVGTGFVNIAGSSLSDWVVGEISHYNGTLTRQGVTRVSTVGRHNGTNDILNSGSTGGELEAPSPGSPTDGVTLNRSDNVSLTWSPTSGAESYYAELWGGPALSVNTGYIASTSWVVGVLPGGSYRWHVKAHYHNGDSGWSRSRALTVKYGSQTELSATAVSASQVNLSWSPSADTPGNIDGYRIYRNGVAVYTVGKTATTFSDSGRNCSKTFSYLVKAYKGSVESDASNVAAATTFSCPQGAGFNFLLNPGAEAGVSMPDKWKSGALMPGSSVLKWASNQFHAGTRSLKIVNLQANDAYWTQSVVVQPNTDYQLSGWIKTKDVAHSNDAVDAGANLSILGGDERTPGLFGSNDWTFVSLTFNTEARTSITVAAQVGFEAGKTTGTAWFDDLKLANIGEAVCYTLQTTVMPAGSGKIKVSPAANCIGGTAYMHGTVVTLTAIPSAGYAFKTWKGDVISTENPKGLVIIADKAISARLIAIP